MCIACQAKPIMASIIKTVDGPRLAPQNGIINSFLTVCTCGGIYYLIKTMWGDNLSFGENYIEGLWRESEV